MNDHDQTDPNPPWNCPICGKSVPAGLMGCPFCHDDPNYKAAPQWEAEAKTAGWKLYENPAPPRTQTWRDALKTPAIGIGIRDAALSLFGPAWTANPVTPGYRILWFAWSSDVFVAWVPLVKTLLALELIRLF